MSAIAAATISTAGALGAAGMGMASSSAANAANKKMMEQLWALAQQGAAPYQRFGKAGAQMFQQMLPQILAQSQYQQFTPEMYQQSPLYTPMVRNLAELQATPGYQFQLQQGQKQLDQSAAARGGLLSGAQMQAAQRAGALQQSNILGDITKQGYTASQGPVLAAQGVAPSVMTSNTYAGNQQGNMWGTVGSTLGNLGSFAANQYGNTAPITSYDQLGNYGGKPIVL